MFLVRTCGPKTPLFHRAKKSESFLNSKSSVLWGRSHLGWSALLVVQLLYFVLTRQTQLSLVLVAVPGVLVAGALFCWFHFPADYLFNLIRGHSGRALTLVLLFFFFVLGHLLLFTMTFSCPLCLIIERIYGGSSIASDFSLYSANCIFFIAIANWSGWVLRSGVLRAAR